MSSNNKDTLWTRNIYRSTGLFTHQIAEDIETQNFYLYNHSIPDLITVYPNNYTRISGIEQKFRNNSGYIKKESLPFMEHFPALSSMIFLLYSRHCEILNEHDKVSILGNVTYDVDADQISND